MQGISRAASCHSE